MRHLIRFSLTVVITAVLTATVLWLCFPAPAAKYAEQKTTLSVLKSEALTFLVTRRVVTQVVVEHEEGDWLVAGPVPNPFTFTTRNELPRIVSTTPADGAVGVSVTEPVFIKFSEPVITSTLRHTFTPAERMQFLDETAEEAGAVDPTEAQQRWIEDPISLSRRTNARGASTIEESAVDEHSRARAIGKLRQLNTPEAARGRSS